MPAAAVLAFFVGLVVFSVGVLQSSGYELTNQAVGSFGSQQHGDWFDTRGKILAALSPPFGIQTFLAELLTIATPLLTGALTAWVGRRTVDADQATEPKKSKKATRPKGLGVADGEPGRQQ